MTARFSLVQATPRRLSIGCALGDNRKTHHDYVGYLNVLLQDVHPEDVLGAPNAGGRVAPVLFYLVSEVSVVDAVASQDADFEIDTLAAPVDDAVDVNSVVSDVPDPSFTEVSTVFRWILSRWAKCLRSFFPGKEADGCINDDEFPVKSIENSLTHPPTSNNLAETPHIARDFTAKASRRQKRCMYIDVNEALSAQRSRAEDCFRVDEPPAKKTSEAPAPM
eukprot:IDg7095t1